MMGPERSPFYSATSLYAFVFALLIYCGLLLIKKSSIRLAAGPVVAIVGIVMIFGVVSLFTGGSAIGSAASTAGRDATLTGRTVVWQALLPIAMRHPVLGDGYGGFWTPEKNHLFQISEAHSGYLEILLDLGFLGLLIYFLFLVSSALKSPSSACL